MARIGVVIPSYNNPTFIRATIDSVRAQTYQDWELVIVDDGSTDETPRTAAEYASIDPRIRLVCQANAGIAATRNRGLMELSSAVQSVIFLDHDDVWEVDTLAVLQALLDKDSDALGAHGLVWRIDDEGRRLARGKLERETHARWGFSTTGVRRAAPNEPTTFDTLIYGNNIVTPGAILLRRDALTDAPFDYTTGPADDWDLWLRLLAGGHFAFAPRVVLNYRIHGSNTSSDKNHLADAEGRIISRVSCNPLLTPARRAFVPRKLKLARRQAVQLRADWMREATRHHDLINAAKQFRHLCLSINEYIRT